MGVRESGVEEQSIIAVLSRGSGALTGLAQGDTVRLRIRAALRTRRYQRTGPAERPV